MRNAFLVALREYTENAKTKGFWIGIFMLPLVLFLSFQIPVLLEKKGAPERHFVLVDFSGQYETVIEEQLEQAHQRRVLEALNEFARANSKAGAPRNPPWEEFADLSPAGIERFQRAGGASNYFVRLRPYLRPDAPPFQTPRRLNRRVPLPVEPREDVNALARALRPYLRGEKWIQVDGARRKLDAAILIPREIGETAAAGAAETNSAVQYWSGNLTDKNLSDQAREAINRELRRREYLARGLDVALYQQIEKRRVSFVELNPKKEPGSERVSKAEVLAQWAPVGFVYLLWVAIFSISQMLLSNTIEEKSNRVIEVLLSSVTPGEFILGKLAGIAALGLTMVGAWLGSLVAVLAWKSGAHSELAAQFMELLRGSRLLPAFVVYFFLGYLLYAGIILAVGSVCNTLKEAQNYMSVITILMMAPLLTMMFIPKDPHGTVATVLSWIPIYTPFIMMNRAAADPPLVDLIGTMILLLAATGAVLWGAVKIFRVGVLRTGQPPKIAELREWLRSR